MEKKTPKKMLRFSKRIQLKNKHKSFVLNALSQSVSINLFPLVKRL